MALSRAAAVSGCIVHRSTAGRLTGAARESVSALPPCALLPGSERASPFAVNLAGTVLMFPRERNHSKL